MEVNAANVHDYVRRYAEYRMVKVAERALEVREGSGVITTGCPKSY